MSSLRSTTLCVEALSCGYGGRTVLSGLSFSLERGQTLCLLGPNGAGKTTLFKTLLGLLPPLSGRITIGGDDTAGWSRRRFAQALAYIPQEHSPAFPFTVGEVVLQGRTPQLGALASIGARDEAVALEVLTALGMQELIQRDYTRLSGGERQMVLIARALAQEPAYLVMDEPTASLDFGNQARVLERIRALAGGGHLGGNLGVHLSGSLGGPLDGSFDGSFGGHSEGGRSDGGHSAANVAAKSPANLAANSLNGTAVREPLGVIMTTHDPNQALLLGGMVACIERDGSFSMGPAEELLTPGRLSRLYGVEVAFGNARLSDGHTLRLCTPVIGSG